MSHASIVVGYNFPRQNASPFYLRVMAALPEFLLNQNTHQKLGIPKFLTLGPDQSIFQ